MLSKSVSVFKTAGAMGAATFFSRILGLVREQVFAFLFGAGNLTDAYQVAFRIPNLLRDLFAEGAMSASLVPLFTRARLEQGDRKAWRVAGLVFRILFFSMGFLSILGIFFASHFVNLFAPSFKNIPGKFDLTVQMTRILFPFFPFVSLAAAFMGILNACGAFFFPAFASALFNFSSVLVGVFFSFFFGHTAGWTGGIQPIVGMAFGVLVGGVIQAFCQLPLLYKKGYQWTKRDKTDLVWYKEPFLRKMLSMLLPGTVGLAATQLNLLINTILATSQGTGAISWLNYAFRLMQFPIGVFGVSIASATLPRVSEQWVREDYAGTSETLLKSLKAVFAINLPSSLGLMVLSVPLVECIFQYGRFYAEDTRSTASALTMYAVGLTAYSTVKVLVPAYYAFGNTKIPVISSVFSVFTTWSLNSILVQPLGYRGLALGTALASIMNAMFLMITIRRFIDLDLVKLFRCFLTYLGVSLAMGAFCHFLYHFLLFCVPDRTVFHYFGVFGLVFGRFLRVFILIGGGAGMVVFFAHLLNLSEVVEVTHFFATKLRNKLRSSST